MMTNHDSHIDTNREVRLVGEGDTTIIKRHCERIELHTLSALEGRINIEFLMLK